MINLATVIPCALWHRVTLRRHRSFQSETFIMFRVCVAPPWRCTAHGITRLRITFPMCNWLSRAYCLSLVILGGLYMKPVGFQIFTIICGLPDDSHKTGDGVP